MANEDEWTHSCPVERVYQKLRVIDKMSPSKEKKAYEQVLNELYIVVKTHKEPAVPVASLEIVQEFIETYIKDPIDPEHIIVLLLILNMCFQPIGLIVRLIQEEERAITLLKHQIVQSCLIEQISYLIVNYITQGDATASDITSKQENLLLLERQYNDLSKELRELNKRNEEARAGQPNGIHKQNEDFERSSTPKDQLQILSLEDKRSSGLMPQQADQQLHQTDEISAIVDDDDLEHKVDNVNAEVIQLKNMIASVKEEMVVDKEKVIDITTCLIEILQLFYYLLITDVGTNDVLFQRMTEYQLFDYIEMVNQLGEEHPIFNKLQPCSIRLYCAIIISRDYIENRQERLLLGSGSREEHDGSIELKIDNTTRQLCKQEHSPVKDHIEMTTLEPVSAETVRLRVPLASSVGPDLVREIQNYGINYQRVIEEKGVLDTQDFSFYKQKNIKRVNLFNKVVDDTGRTIPGQAQQHVKKTIEITNIPTCFGFVVNQQRESQHEQRMVELALSNQLVFAILGSVLRGASGYITAQVNQLEQSNKELNNCVKYDYADMKVQRRAFGCMLVEAVTGINKHLLANWRDASWDRASKTLEVGKAALAYLNEQARDYMGLHGEVKQYSYEYKDMRESLVGFFYFYSCVILACRQEAEERQKLVTCRIRAKIEQEAVLNNEKMVAALGLDRQAEEEKIQQLADEIEALERECQERDRVLGDSFNELYSSDLLDMLQAEIKRWELVKYMSSQSACYMLKLLRGFDNLYRFMECCADERTGLVRVVERRRVYTRERSSSVSGVSSDSTSLQHGSLLNVHGSDDQLDTPEPHGHVEQEEQVWLPDYIYLFYILNSKLVDKLCLLMYVLIFHNISREQREHVRFVCSLFRYLEAFDKGYKCMSVQMETINSLCMIEQVLSSELQWLEEVQDVFEKIIKQIHANSRSEEIYIFIDSLFVVPEFKYKTLLDHAHGLEVDAINKLQDVPAAAPAGGALKETEEVLTEAYEDNTLFNESSISVHRESEGHASDDLSSNSLGEAPQLQIEDDEFTKEEDDVLLNQYVPLILQHTEQTGINKLVELFQYKYSRSELMARFAELNIGSREWQPAEIELLREKNEEPISDLAVMLKRRPQDVEEKLNEMMMKDKK